MVGTEFGGDSRLRRPDEFSAVLARRRPVRSAHFEVHYVPNGRASARLGLIVGRKADKRAVVRNLSKRIAREAFRAIWGRLPALDVVVRASRPLRGTARRELRAEIDALLGPLAR
ncbi:MAG: ribonuclease P protein component [Rhodocyclaceae bacterium]|jgi:ribonuclease P protein component